VLSDILKKYSNDLLHPLGVFMGRIGIRPNNLTFLGLALTMAAAWQLHAAAILPGVALLLLAGLADGGDGLLARSAGQTSVRGGPRVTRNARRAARHMPSGPVTVTRTPASTMITGTRYC